MLKRTAIDKEEFARLARDGASVHRLSARYGLSLPSVRRLAAELGVKPRGVKEIRQRAALSARVDR